MHGGPGPDFTLYGGSAGDGSCVRRRRGRRLRDDDRRERQRRGVRRSGIDDYWSDPGDDVTERRDLRSLLRGVARENGGGGRSPPPPVCSIAWVVTASSASLRSTRIDRKVDRETVRRVVRTFRPYKGKVGLVGLMIGVTSGLGVINPLMIVRSSTTPCSARTGSVRGSRAPTCRCCTSTSAIMIAVPIVTSIIGIGQTYLTNIVGLNVMQDLRIRLYQHLQVMPLRFFTHDADRARSSRRLANDVGGVQSVVTDTASTVLSNVVTIISTIIAMLLISIPLTILSLLLMPLFLWLTVKVGRARREVATSTQRTLADMTTDHRGDALSVSGILLSKAFGRQRFEIDRFRSENERLTGFLLRQTMIGRSFFALVGTFFSITPALVYLVAGWVNSRRRPADHRRGDARRLHHAAVAALLPDRLDAPGVHRGAVLARAVRSDLRVPRPAARDPRRAGRGDDPRRRRAACGSETCASGTRTHPRASPVSPEASPLGDDDPSPRVDARRRRPRHQAGTARGARRTVGRRQDHRDLPRAAVSTTSRKVPSRSTGSTSGRSRSSRSARRSGWSRRRPTCSTTRSGATSSTASPTPPTRS